MIGTDYKALDASNWIRGMSSGAVIADGGFSNESDDLNLHTVPGVVYGRANVVDGDANTVLDDEIIASCSDAAAGASFDRMVMTDDGDFMTYNGTVLADVSGGQDTTRNYAKGFSDMVSWLGRIYFTSKEQLGEWQLPSTFNFTFSAFANSGVPHPLLVYENNLYIADGNLLKRMTTAGGSVSTIITLGTGEFIQALGIDPGNGKMLISIVNGQNIGSTLPRRNKVAWYDGNSNKLDKVIDVEEMVTAFHSHQGQLFVGYGKNVGVLTSSGISFLRELTRISLDEAQLPYKHNFASIGKTLFVVDNTRILAYGQIVAGAPRVWYPFAEQAATIQSIFNAGNNKLGLSAFVSSTSVFRTINVTTNSTSDGWDLYTNWINFPRPVKIISFDIYFDSTLDSSANLEMSYFDQSSTSAITSSLASLDGTQTNVTQLRKITGFTNPLTSLKLRIRTTTSNENPGIKYLIIYYEQYE